MLHVSDTAYPRLKAHPTERDLEELFTPNLAELTFAYKYTRRLGPRVALLVLLKTFQRLGYFVKFADVPPAVIQHIIRTAQCPNIPDDITTYDNSTYRVRYVYLVRIFMNVSAFDAVARRIVIEASVAAARTRDDLADIINIAIEELVRQRYELPVFNTLLHIARTARSAVNRGYHRHIHQALDEATKARLQAMLRRPPGQSRTPWDQVKTEPRRPTHHNVRAFLNQLDWLRAQSTGTQVFDAIPGVKVRQFAAEAWALNAAVMNELVEPKRYTLMAALLQGQLARALDDIAEMFIRQVHQMHNSAKEALARYQTEHAGEVDALITLLHETVRAYQGEGSREERFAAIEALLGPDADDILQRCEAHAALAGDNHFPFLLKSYQSRRSLLLRVLSSVELRASSQDRALEEAIAFVLAHKDHRRAKLKIIEQERLPDGSERLVQKIDLSFVSNKWWLLVTGKVSQQNPPTEVDRRYFELCVLSQVMQELKSGDLYILGSADYSDYREQLVSWEDYQREIATYGQQAGVPIEPKAFIGQLRAQLDEAAQQADTGFPENEYLRIENGVPVLKRLHAKPEIEGAKRLEQLLQERTDPIGIIDALIDTEHWLNWTHHFGPLSGLEAKLDSPRERYLVTAFCYGCNLGPTQTARSIKELDRRHIAFVNQRHVTEERLNEAITTVVNAYASLGLQKLWGSGRSASADGTQWELYPQNLIATYHIRYGDYGGIGYYLVADSYIALFSRFIACGTWEGHYILDFINENRSDVQPDAIHSDTQGQSETIFGLAYLLGIQLMPRIRHWKHLHFYRPSKDSHYHHINSLFTTDIHWELIETLLPDMLRVAVSVKLGCVTPSAILRRLGTYSRKNKLYFAFRELGRVTRTIFLLRYLSDPKLRRQIQRATNKSEAFNKFAQWVLFGGGGVIAENIRDEQRKIIKYNPLVANLLIFHTLVTMMRTLQRLENEGHVIEKEVLEVLSPYQTEHINRFGNYTVNMNRVPEPLDFKLR
jgi:TnpA family transposase